jgi:hypothetical protein
LGVTLKKSPGKFKAQPDDSRVEGPEDEDAYDGEVLGVFDLECDRFDRTSCILADDRAPRSNSGKYRYILAGDHIFGAFLLCQQRVARGRTRYVGREFVTGLAIVYGQGEGLDTRKGDPFFERRPLAICLR